MRRSVVGIGLLFLVTWLGRPCPAQSPPAVVDLNVTPAESAEPSQAPRLLPTDPELKDGNAAVVMLRMIWEQQPYMQKVLPKYRELLELPYTDPRIAKELAFDSFQRQLRRAAYMKTADWNYPIQEERFDFILLPDAQGLRGLAGHGLAMWTGSRLAAGDFHNAREGVLVQLACSRHMARTPIAINRLVAEALATQGLTSVERWIGTAESPNLYWGLARLPDELGDSMSMLQWQSESLVRSLPTLKAGMIGDQDPRWQNALAELAELLVVSPNAELVAQEIKRLREKAIVTAREDLAKRAGFSTERVAKLSSDATIVLWALAVHAEVSAEYEAAFSLAPREAIASLTIAEKNLIEIVQRVGSKATPFPETGVGLYLATHRFDRRVKVLQTLEAIRDHVAKSGKLPSKLEDLRLPAPVDPLTGQPFEYQLADGTAILRTPTVAGITDNQQATIAASYRIRVKP